MMKMMRKLQKMSCLKKHLKLFQKWQECSIQIIIKKKEQESTSSVNENEQCLDSRKEDVKPKKKGHYRKRQ